MEKVQTRKYVINNVSEFFDAVQGSNIKVTIINTTELEKYADNGYVTKRYSSFIINESTATEVEENSKEVKI